MLADRRDAATGVRRRGGFHPRRVARWHDGAPAVVGVRGTRPAASRPRERREVGRHQHLLDDLMEQVPRIADDAELLEDRLGGRTVVR